jgi:hypothetical protein
MPGGNCVTTVADVAKTIRIQVIDCWDTKDGDKIPDHRVPTRTIPATTITITAKNQPLTVVTLRTKRSKNLWKRITLRLRSQRSTTPSKETWMVER